MWQRLNLFWRYFLTGFICIVLSAVATFVVIESLQKRDSRNTFIEETTHVFQEIEQMGTQAFIQQTHNTDFPFKVTFSDAFDGELNHVYQYDDNHFWVVHYSPTLGYVTIKDKPVYDSENQSEQDREHETHAWFDFLERVIWLSAIVLFLGLSFYLVNRQTQRHIHDLVDASKAISEGDFDTLVPTQSPEPIQQLAKQLDTTRQNIKHLVEKERTLAFAIPHELRTPVSKIRLALDLSRDHETVADYETLVEDLDAYTDELERLITDLLALAKNNDSVELSDVPLANMLDDIANEYRLLHPNKTLTIHNNLEHIQSSELQLKLILNNLIQNAFKYADACISVEVYALSDKICILVSNDGKSIPADMRERIFDPFTRVDGSRNRKTGGVGLGLPLVKQAVEQLGGDIKLLDDKSMTCFEVVLFKSENISKSALSNQFISRISN